MSVGWPSPQYVLYSCPCVLFFRRELDQLQANVMAWYESFKLDKKRRVANAIAEALEREYVRRKRAQEESEATPTATCSSAGEGTEECLQR